MILKIVKIYLALSGVMGRVGSLPRWFPLFNFFCLLVFRLTSSVALWGGGMLQIALSCAHSISAPLDLSLLAVHKPLRLYDAQPGTVWGRS